jgi:hypothetical protein
MGPDYTRPIFMRLKVLASTTEQANLVNGDSLADPGNINHVPPAVPGFHLLETNILRWVLHVGRLVTISSQNLSRSTRMMHRTAGSNARWTPDETACEVPGVKCLLLSINVILINLTT